MKILLVDTNRIEPRIAPVGLEYIGEHLQKKGHYVKIMNNGYDVFADKDITYYDLIGLSIRNIDNTGFEEKEFYLPEIKNLVSEIKNHTSSPVVIGGPAVNIIPHEIREYVDADFAVVDKGFKSFDSLIRWLHIGILKSKVLKDRHDYVKGRFKRNMLSHSGYKTRIGVSTKFGCPFNCSYCTYPAVDGRGLRERPVDEVLYEIESLHGQGVRNIFFTDSSFNVSEKHAIAVLKQMNDRKLGISWEGFINPNPYELTDDFLNEVVKSGKETLTFGVDAISKKSLKYLNKEFSVDDICRATEMCHANDIDVNYSVLFGHPRETEQDMLETFENIDRLQPRHVDVVVGIRLFPRTPIYRQCLKNETVKPEQNLLEPYYIPIDDKLKQRIIEETKARPNCHLSDPESLKRYGPTKQR